MVKQILNKNIKKLICKQILENLSNWFEDEVARNNYIKECENLPFFSFEENNDSLGFLCGKKTSNVALELYVMGVKTNHQRKGIGSKLFNELLNYARIEGVKFIHVKTVEEGRYPEYDSTNKFYQKLGFEKLEVLSNLWDENNPCQVYVLALN